MDKKNKKDVQEDPEAVKETDQQTEEKMQEDTEAAKAAAKETDEKMPENAAEIRADEKSPMRYKIICRNKITKRIGGVDFTNGEGYTSDGYAASWFAAKDGYTVEPAE